MMNMYFLGIDGGGTKTTCLVCDENLNEIYRTVGGSINFYSEGMENARRNMSEMLSETEKNTGIADFAAVCVGSSALFGRADEKLKKSFCDGVFSCDKILLDSDLFIALKAAKDKNPVIVIAGTGSMTAAFGVDGKIITKGGYGYILGDEGSGYRIAVDGIRAAVRSFDKTGEKTVLEQKLFEFADTDNADGLIEFFYSEKTDRKRIASFAKQVCQSAIDGDKVCFDILSCQAQQLSCTVKALLKEIEPEPSIYLYGGIFQNCEMYSKLFSSYFDVEAVTCVPLLCEPVFGAAVAAKEFFENDN